MSDKMLKTKSKFRLTETHRTVILLILIALAVGFIYWIQSGIDENFTDTF